MCTFGGVAVVITVAVAVATDVGSVGGWCQGCRSYRCGSVRGGGSMVGGCPMRIVMGVVAAVAVLYAVAIAVAAAIEESGDACFHGRFIGHGKLKGRRGPHPAAHKEKKSSQCACACASVGDGG